MVSYLARTLGLLAVLSPSAPTLYHHDVMHVGKDTKALRILRATKNSAGLGVRLRYQYINLQVLASTSTDSDNYR